MGKTAATRVRGSLIASEMEEALDYWIRSTQHEWFDDKMTGRKHENFRRQLDLFVESDGRIRCRTRLQNSDLSFESQNPLLLPQDDYLTKLIIADAHAKVFHAGASHTLAKVREKFWIVHGKSTVKKVLKNCCLCRKFEGGPFNAPKPPSLPDFRVCRFRPFENVGVDYLGPLFIRQPDNSSAKVWICLFTCAATRAIHLEVANDLTAEQFLYCFRRFVSLFGVPTLVVSDNGTQFQKTNKTLEKAWKAALTDNKTKEFAAKSNIKWKFITALAPWMGGFYERLVSPVKRALKRSLDHKRVALIELQTLCYEIAQSINTRPLTHIDSDLGPQPLRPADFLLKGPGQLPSVVKCDGTSSSMITSWKRGQRILDQCWNVWRQAYLAELHSKSWNHKNRGGVDLEPKVGMVVQISDRMPRGAWKLGMINHLITGSDGKIRSVGVRLAGGSLITRAIKHLHPLEGEHGID